MYKIGMVDDKVLEQVEHVEGVAGNTTGRHAEIPQQLRVTGSTDNQKYI